MRSTNRNSKLWIYLNQSGVLDTEDETVIKEKIKEYYRIYDKELKKQKRNIDKRNFTISFPTIEIQHIRNRAKQYNSDIPTYIKVLVKADLTNTTFIENTLTYKEILQALQYYKNAVKDIEEKDVKNWLGSNKNYDALVKIIQSLENKIIVLTQKIL